MKLADCHSERRHYGRGLCKRCYMKRWNAVHPRINDPKYAKAYYMAHADVIKKRTHQNRIKNKLINRRMVLEYLGVHPCVDCGEADVVVLEFDHVRGVKHSDVSFLITNGSCWSFLLREIAKCEVRCANCHRRKTAKDGKHYRTLYACG